MGLPSSLIQPTDRLSSSASAGATARMHKFHLNKPIDRSTGQAIHTSRLSIHIVGRPAFSNDALTAFKRLLLPLFVYQKKKRRVLGRAASQPFLAVEVIVLSSPTPLLSSLEIQRR